MAAGGCDADSEGSAPSTWPERFLAALVIFGGGAFVVWAIWATWGRGDIQGWTFIGVTFGWLVAMVCTGKFLGDRTDRRAMAASAQNGPKVTEPEDAPSPP